MSSNRRSASRHPVSMTVTLVVQDRVFERVLDNLSLGGAHVRNDFVLPIGSTVEVRLSIPTQPEPIVTKARVRWSDDVGLGLQFDGLRAREVWSLTRYFEQLSS